MLFLKQNSIKYRFRNGLSSNGRTTNSGFVNIGSTPISPSKTPIHRNRIYQARLDVVKFHAADRSAWRPSSDVKIAVLRNAESFKSPVRAFFFLCASYVSASSHGKFFSLILYLAVPICFARPKGLLSAVLKRRRSAFANRIYIAAFWLNLHRPSTETIGAKKERENE